MKTALIHWLRRVHDAVAAPVFTELLQERLADLEALQLLAPLSTGFIPWPKPAIRPRCLVTVLNDIVINERRCLVELGGGVSTIYLARLLRTRGGHLTTIEEDEKWAKMLQSMLASENLHDSVTVVTAPVLARGMGTSSLPWYEENALSEKLSKEPIDLLLVDGPASRLDVPLIRYGALPFFDKKMSPRCSIILDDARRKDEQEVIKRWSQEFNVEFRISGTFAFGTRGSAYKVSI